MRKLLLFIFILFWQNPLQGQTDSICGLIPVRNGIATYTGILNIENKSANQIYTLAKVWIGKTFSNPKEVIVADVENSLLTLKIVINDPDVSGSIYRFNFVLQFKEGRCRYELSSIYFLAPRYNIEHRIEDIPALKTKTPESVSRINKVFESFLLVFKNELVVEENW